MNKQNDQLLQLGLNVRQRRHIVGLTQKELAARLGCSAQTVSRIEHGGNVPVDMVMRLSRALGWTLPELLRGV